MQVVPVPDVSGLRTTARDASCVVRCTLPLSVSLTSSERIAIAAILLHHYLAHEKAGITFVTNDQQHVQVDFNTQLEDYNTASLQDVERLIEQTKQTRSKDDAGQQDAPIAAAALIHGCMEEADAYLKHGQVGTVKIVVAQKKEEED